MAFTLKWQLLVDGEPDPVLTRLIESSPQEASALCEQLWHRAKQGGSPEWNLYAIGLAETGSDLRAIKAWETLLKRDEGYLVGWLNLATVWARRNKYALVAETLRRGRAHAATEAQRHEIDRRLEEVEWVERATAQQMRLLHLRVAALRERVELEIAQPSDTFRLARLLTMLSRADGSSVTAEEALSAARLARVDSPGDPRVLEILALSLMQVGNDEELGDVLRELERLAPHSIAFKSLRTNRSKEVQVQAQWFERRTAELLGRTVQGDREAEREVRNLSRMNPRNQRYRDALMMAALARSDDAEAARLAESLEAEPHPDHLTHLHLAQYFWVAKQRD
jgi:hypothetical protein